MSAEDRSRTVTWADPAITAAAGQRRAGLDVLRAIAGGELPPPPIASLLGMEVVEADPGRTVFALTPAEWMYNPLGAVHGGIAATLLDSCMACAIQTTLPAGTPYTTTDLQVRYLRGMTTQTGRVRAEGTVVHAGRRLATAEGRLVTEHGAKLIAHGSTACLVVG